jgi:acyl carrier protein
MSATDTLALIRTCMQQALKLSDAEAALINDETTPLDFAQWTSAAHLELLLGIENKTGIMFEADEMGALASVKAIRASLEAKQA